MLRLALLVSLAFASTASADIPRHRCGTPELLATRPIPKLASPDSIPLRGGPEKMVREGFPGTSFQELLSPNFAIKWADPSVSAADAQIVADALELSWVKYIDELGHDPCFGCETFRLNAYIARDEGIDNPGIGFAGGYAFIDNDGFPYFVISRNLIAPGNEDSIRGVAVHEFYHDIQFSTGSFAWETTPYGWFWESTAEWATQEALPGNSNGFVFTGAYALKSELPVYHYGDPFGGDPVEGVHQYGSSIFFRHVTEKLASPAIIVNTWENSTANDEPLQKIQDNLPSSNIVALFSEFAARNAIWDYEWRDQVINSIGTYKQFDPSLSEVMFRVPSAGVPMTDLPRSPYGFGYSTIELDRPATGRFEFEILKAPVPGGMFATVVHGAPGSATYTPLEVNAASNAATGSFVFPEGLFRAYLVVGVFTEDRLTTAPVTLSFRVSPIEIEPEPEPEVPGEGGGCCDAGSSPVGSLALALVALVGLRRKRRR
jgi:uncharacterized protein (TIGR03382 family)